jgi:hypothetical protein
MSANDTIPGRVHVTIVGLDEEATSFELVVAHWWPTPAILPYLRPRASSSWWLTFSLAAATSEVESHKPRSEDHGLSWTGRGCCRPEVTDHDLKDRGLKSQTLR